MERDRGDAAFAHRDRMAPNLTQNAHGASRFLYPGCPDEDRPEGSINQFFNLDFFLEAGQLPTERVAPGRDVDQSEVLPARDDHSGAGSQHGSTRFMMGADRRRKPGILDSHDDRRALPARENQAVEPSQVFRQADFHRYRTGTTQMLHMPLEPALDGEYANPGLPCGTACGFTSPVGQGGRPRQGRQSQCPAWPHPVARMRRRCDRHR